MFNLKMIEMIKYSLQTVNIDEISLCATGLEVCFYHLIHYIGPEYFNTQKSVLYTENSVVSQVITLNKNEIT